MTLRSAWTLPATPDAKPLAVAMPTTAPRVAANLNAHRWLGITVVLLERGRDGLRRNNRSRTSPLPPFSKTWFAAATLRTPEAAPVAGRPNPACARMLPAAIPRRGRRMARVTGRRDPPIAAAKADKPPPRKLQGHSAKPARRLARRDACATQDGVAAGVPERLARPDLPDRTTGGRDRPSQA